MRFLHMADAHLGYRQYNSDERARDFGRALYQMCQGAIAEECDLVLIAGDLFHSSAMDSRTFLQAARALEPLRDEGIPVVAIAGNHDRARTSHGLNWLHALQHLRLLTLLEIGIEEGEVSLEKAIRIRGGFRVVGVPYVAAALPQILDQVRDCLSVVVPDLPMFTILLLHAGLIGEVPGFHSFLTMEDLEPLRPYVDYVALGHIHKPYGRAAPDDYREPWLQNPGSLETVSIDEAQWKHRGGTMVCVEDGKAMDFEWAIPDRRPFILLDLEVDDCPTPARLMDELHDHLVAYGWDKESLNPLAPVVTLTLTGTLAFDRRGLDIAAMEQAVQHAFQPLLARIRDHTEADASAITVAEDAPRAEIEYHVVRELVARDASRKEHADLWTAMILDIKDMALTRSAPERVIEETRAFRQRLGETESR